MKGLFVLSLCLMLAGSQAFLFDEVKSFFGGLGSKLLSVGKALVAKAKDTAVNLLTDGVKSAGIVLANSLNPVVGTSPAAKRELSALQSILEIAGKIFRPILEDKFGDLERIVGEGIQGALQLVHQKGRRELDEEDFNEQLEQVIAEHRRKVRSIFGDILGHAIDYGKVVLNAIRTKLDAIKKIVGIEKRDAVFQVKSRCSDEIAKMIADSQKKAQDTMKDVRDAHIL